MMRLVPHFTDHDCGCIGCPEWSGPHGRHRLDHARGNAIAVRVVRLDGEIAWFDHFSRSGSALFAWSLAGARLFVRGELQLLGVVRVLEAKGYEPESVELAVPPRRVVRLPPKL